MSKNVEQDVAFIRALADLLKEAELTEIEVKREYADNDELNVRLSRAASAAPVQIHHAAPAPVGSAAAPVAAAPVVSDAPTGPDLSNALTSPMVGTVYLAAEPGAEPFVKAGDTVTEGQTVLVIEAMKTMNQIPSPRAGTVRQILVANADPVEFGHPLMIID
ncbi:MAG TPA: acetyl-CoA carboxylase biotin carboxyl carrier protein [Thermohalobaculum sp.]|nr:acetyl-CoA carboxylase biotin carboxyl carrier protein [Thermohalobaculum sp.]